MLLLSRLRQAGIRVKFVTNESSRTRASLHAKLTRLGFELELEDILTPAMAMMLIIREKKLRPHLLVHPNVMEDFAGVDISDPNSVIIGDMAEHITFHNLNETFQVRVYQCLREQNTQSCVGGSCKAESRAVAPVLPGKGQVLPGGRESTA